MGKINECIESLLEYIWGTKRNSLILFLLSISVLTVYMLYINRPLYHGHDMVTHFHRLEGLMEALRDGRFPWYINYNGLGGIGYFVKAFYCDILLIPFAIIGLLSSIHTAYIVMLASLTLLSGYSMYYSVGKISGNYIAAFFAGLLYSFCSYRLLSLYQRSAIGEIFVYLALPLILWGVYELLKGDYKKWYILAIGYSMVVYSHLIFTVLTFILLAIFFIANVKVFIRERKRLYALLIASLACFLITACYTLPMLEQIQSNEFYFSSSESIPDVMGLTLSLSGILAGLFNASSYYDASFNYAIKIGLSLSLAILFRLFILKKDKWTKYADYSLLVSIILIFMISKYFPWSFYPFKLLSFMQYPYRLLLFISFFLPFSGAIYIAQILRDKRYIVYSFIAICFIAICFINITSEAQNYTHRMRVERGDRSVFDIDDYYSYGNNEYLPSKVKSQYTMDMNYQKQILGDLKGFKIDKGVISFTPTTNRKTEVPIVYYKGYSISQNEKPIEFKQSENGFLEMDIKNTEKVEVYYAGTCIQKISMLISVIAWLVLASYIARYRRKKQ